MCPAPFRGIATRQYSYYLGADTFLLRSSLESLVIDQTSKTRLDWFVERAPGMFANLNELRLSFPGLWQYWWRWGCESLQNILDEASKLEIKEVSVTKTTFSPNLDFSKSPPSLISIARPFLRRLKLELDSKLYNDGIDVDNSTKFLRSQQLPPLLEQFDLMLGGYQPLKIAALLIKSSG